MDFKKLKPVPAPPPLPASYIDKAIFKKTLGLNDTNSFTNFLIVLFGKERAKMLVNKYHIGTTKSGEVIFYQVDLQGNVRSGKVMKYNLTASTQTALGRDCKRDKSINPNWVHSILKLPERPEGFNLKQCLFGEHLLNDNRTVAIVESAKSAVIASVYYPCFVWVSCESKDGLNLDKLKVLKGRNVILFPDLGGFEKWTTKANEITFCKSVKVSDLLEQVATDAERANGLDLADYLLRYSPAPEAKPATKPPTAPETMPAPASTPLSVEEIRAKLIIEWFLEHGKIFDGTFCMDGIAINDIRKVIVNHIQTIENDLLSSLSSIEFLEKIKKTFTGIN